jgi:hypothetical protein
MHARFDCANSDHEISLPQLTIDIFRSLRKGLPEVAVAAPEPSAERDWRRIASMRWCMLSDGPLDNVDTIRARIEQEGSVQSLSQALERRSRRLLQVCPDLSKNAAWQITALGPTIVKVIIDTIDMLQFFEKELQPIDICALLT